MLRQSEEKTTLPLRDELNQFLGFLEGRTGVTIPGWWARMILSAERMMTKAASEPRSRLGFRIDDEGKAEFHEPLRHFRTPKTLTVTLDVDHFVARIDDVEFMVYEERPHSGMAAIADSSTVFWTLFSSLGGEHPLQCVDADSGEIRWKSEVWGIERIGGTSEGQFVVVARDGHEGVCVFGGGGFGCYVECFDPQDGHNRWRFAATLDNTPGLEYRPEE